ncbi:replication initiator [Phycicoccus sp. Soil803]|uniref:replication initiator n=1 Tax=Phycicoccus sp. Soil803 TaxID=1736415 RepID=UPI00071051F0|nr:replication initiation protein [Phycicoccus sp. Soil803]
MATPPLRDHVVRLVASLEGVCVRPVVRRVTDRVTGESVVRALDCGTTLESKCHACAAKARRLRITQCTEGWHLTREPEVGKMTEPPTEDRDDVPSDVADADDDATQARRVRSTRRLDGMPQLPQQPVQDRTVGAVFAAGEGKEYRPSMFVTLTLGSYGRVYPGRGVPVRPERYDYRRAALDALHFPRLMDRWFQNLRRCAGYRVQYFGAIEAQKRLAPHFHVALRGAIPRATLKAVTRATYLALWWPQMDTPVYVERTPVWDDGAYRDPDTGYPLPSWDQALADVDDDQAAQPAHVVTFGRQVDVKGILGGSKDSARAVRYLTKYLTKSITDTYADEDDPDPAYEAHIDRLHDQIRWLPCTPECANWLRYGTQPNNPGPGLVPGHCASKAHDREHLGLGGRRVLVSRGWSGKTLSQHKADRRAVVEQVLSAAGIQPDDANRMAADTLTEDGKPRFVWVEVPVTQGDWARVVMDSMREHDRRRDQYERAKAIVAGTDPPVDNLSANQHSSSDDAA